MVANELGVTILPENFVLPYQKLLGIVAITIDEDWAKRCIAIVTKSEVKTTGPARRFFEWLVENRQNT